MEINTINWPGLKEKDYLKWRSSLWEETQKILTNSGRVELLQYNGFGFFHRVSNKDAFEGMQREWQAQGRIPQEWIGKGVYPGIWTAMFSPHNTFSIAVLPILIIRFYFRKGYFVFDARNQSHKELLEVWLKKNKTIKNPWSHLKNSQGESLEERMKCHEYPSFKKFFEDNYFGALIGYSDYIAVIIVLEDSIQKAEFLLIR